MFPKLSRKWRLQTYQHALAACPSDAHIIHNIGLPQLINPTLICGELLVSHHGGSILFNMHTETGVTSTSRAARPSCLGQDLLQRQEEEFTV